MATMMYPSLTKSQSMRAKRKSAVELLAESKPFYVKSEVVRDNTQQLPLRPHSNVGGYGTYNRSKSVQVTSTSCVYKQIHNMPQYMAVSPSRSLPPLTHRRRPPPIGAPAPLPIQHFTATTAPPTSTDLLQNRLRQLLVCDSAEELRVDQMAPLSPPAEYSSPRCHKSLPDLHCRGGSGGSGGAEPSSNKSSNKSLSNRDSGGSSGHYTQRSEPAPPPRQFCSQDSTRRDSGSSTQHSGGSSYYCCQEPDCRGGVALQPLPLQSRHQLPPTTGFKRQKCLRYKRDRPILRSKSDISDRYWRPPEPPTSHLEQFFDHLGLTTDSYEEMLSGHGSRSSGSSPVYFSDCSTVDSSKPFDNNSGVDCCPSQQQNPSYRNSEPPSIVERNARIIKWLCNCRKSQLTSNLSTKSEIIRVKQSILNERGFRVPFR
ncbi:protein FAM110B [Anthonomus grandis grandis]|uniref:protein FAM110B n=1 Tax=Anthonomus grandis grandis TaxID=2921223 RepID=UPI0021662F44|nr:protein FAM110B [Anthonomus grandis grandis]